jgi:hypothetical protein
MLSVLELLWMLTENFHLKSAATSFCWKEKNLLESFLRIELGAFTTEFVSRPYGIVYMSLSTTQIIVCLDWGETAALLLCNNNAHTNRGWFSCIEIHPRYQDGDPSDNLFDSKQLQVCQGTKCADRVFTLCARIESTLIDILLSLYPQSPKIFQPRLLWHTSRLSISHSPDRSCQSNYPQPSLMFHKEHSESRKVSH